MYIAYGNIPKCGYFIVKNKTKKGLIKELRTFIENDLEEKMYVNLGSPKWNSWNRQKIHESSRKIFKDWEINNNGKLIDFFEVFDEFLYKTA